MIDLASIRAAARAQPGDSVGMSKAQLELLLEEIETGQRARRALKVLVTDMADPACGYQAGIEPFTDPQNA